MFIGTALSSRESSVAALGSWITSPPADREHTHESAHFMFISAGSFLTGSRPARARSPLIFNPPNTTHRDRFESPGRFFSVSLIAHPDDVPSSPVEVVNVASHVLIARLMRESERWDDDSPEIADELVTDLVSTLTNQRDDSARPAWLAIASELLASGARLPLADLSRDIGVHRTHLTRAFRRFYGCTPAEFARYARLRRAASILSATKLPLADVALGAGFADQSHFTKHFRAAYGVPPGEYRRLS